ncbi:MAG: RnfABCDGE type electron transport complex subunit D, partial [Treponema sp.]|nr:RnfABCDGE type electron transport complex subunit D [Treponema sp.]
KEFFGGLGANVFNPALTGRAFLVMSFPAALTTWTMPRLPQNAFANGAFSADVITGASTLGITRTGEGVAAVSKALAEAGLSNSDSYWAAMKTLFFGYRAGSTGETSIFLIFAALIFLVLTKTIDWRMPVCMIATGLVSSVALGMDPLLTVMSGGLVFGAVFMATDYVTTPVTGKGKVIFGIGAGLITMLIRKWGIYPEGVMFSILIMNAVTPFLNKLLAKKYGFVPQKKEGAAK